MVLDRMLAPISIATRAIAVTHADTSASVFVCPDCWERVRE
jgi:hypothetical protein